MARSVAYFVADDQTREKVVEWAAQHEEYEARLRDLTLAVSNPIPGMAGMMVPRAVIEEFTIAADALKEPDLAKALGFKRSYDLIKTDSGFFTLPDLDAEKLLEQVVLTISCNEQGKPVYAPSESWTEISEAEYRQKRQAHWEATAGPVRKLLSRVVEYLR